MVYERPIGMATPTVNELEDEIAELEAELEEKDSILTAEVKRLAAKCDENQKLWDLLLSVNHDNCDHLDDAIMMIQQALEDE